MADDPEMDKRDYMGMSRKVAKLFNAMITYAYELRPREKPGARRERAFPVTGAINSIVHVMSVG
jgi:hypothetical protein